jgi:hypothetical protein
LTALFAPLTLKGCGVSTHAIRKRQTLVRNIHENKMAIIVAGLGYQMDVDPLIGNETLT